MMKKTGKKVGMTMGFLVFFIILTGVISAYAAEKENSNRFNVMVVLDASGSMTGTDPNGLRFEAINQFVNLLAEQGNYLGGIVFSTGISVNQTPAVINSQQDKTKITQLLKSVQAEGWTNIGDALSEAVNALKEKGNPNLPSVIVFLSDGYTEMQNAEETRRSNEKKEEAVLRAKANGIEIYGVCLNVSQVAQIAEMAKMSEDTGGVFQEVSSAEDLKDVFNTFYNLIYGTSTIPLIDDTFPDNGIVEKEFEIPGLGVEEVNIIIYGKTSKVTLIKPDGSESGALPIINDTFTMVKVTDIIAGKWKIVTSGVAGDQIKINMVYNTNLGIDVAVNNTDGAINPEDPVKVKATLKSGDAAAESGQYTGYTAILHILNSDGVELEFIQMEFSDGFEISKRLSEGIYFLKVSVFGNHLKKESSSIGPVVISSSAASEREKNNKAPVPKKNPVKKTIYTWSFKNIGNTRIDLNKLISDDGEEALKYEIIQNMKSGKTQISGDNILAMSDVKGGTVTIRATDIFGSYCDMEIVVKIGSMWKIMLISAGIITIIILIIIAVRYYILSTRSFGGMISARSYCNGAYRGVPYTPYSGKCRLSQFDMQPIGLDYNKSYFLATGRDFIWLITDRKVVCNGSETKKIQIRSGMETRVSLKGDNAKQLCIKFESSRRKNIRTSR